MNKVPLYSTWNYIQYPVINQSGKEYGKEYRYIYIYIYIYMYTHTHVHIAYIHIHIGFPGRASGKESAGDSRATGSVAGSRGRNGNLHWYSCLGNSMDRGAWWAMVHRVAKSQTQLKQLSTAQAYYRCFASMNMY